VCGKVLLWWVREVSFSCSICRFVDEVVMEVGRVCADECFSPIMSIAEIFPTMVIVGMFPRIPQPECESFALHRHDWQGKHADLVQYEIARGGKKLGE
jgi:hypothetical protein